MKRWTLRILLCLILGAVTTVAVAWGLVYAGFKSEQALIRLTWAGSSPASRELAQMLENCGHELRGTEWTVSVYRTSGLQAMRVYALPPADTVSTQHVPHAEIVRCGWPVLALGDIGVSSVDRGYLAFLYDRGSAIVEMSTVFEGAPLAWTRPFPVAPILPGFLINTLFYSGIWLGLFLGVGALRRTVRRRRGRCPRCGYDLRGDPDGGCPECGFRREHPAN